MKIIVIHIIFILFCLPLKSQTLFLQDVFYGGVTGVNFSTGGFAETINSSVLIPPNSTIKKAYLIAATDSTPTPLTVTLNGNNYTFNNSSIITNGFISYQNSTVTSSNSSIRVIDITTDIDSSITNYTMLIPAQPLGYIAFYSDFYLYIVYKNSLLPKISCNLFLNTQNVSIFNFYKLSGLVPIDNTKPVGLELLTSDFCFLADGSFVGVNGNQIGLIYGTNSNSINGCGAYTDFAHYNDTLFGLRNDTPDSLMNGADALADIKSYVNNNDTTVDVTFTKNPAGGNNLTNPIRLLMLSYSTPCDTFTTTITQNDTICFGDSVQLNATGGVQYSWFGAFGGLSDTSIANPMASPPQTTTYIVTITNDSGCVKTEQVKIWVNPLPVADTIIVVPNNCGDTIGSLQVGNVPNGTPPYNYQITNLQNTNITNQNTNIFDSLVAGNYEIQITDSNGCQWIDTVTVNEVNNVVANFTANPQNGVAPLSVDFSNTSLNANNFSWSIANSNGDTIFWIPACAGNVVNCGFSYTFNNSGTYQVCLVAYNNIPTCADTICKTIIVSEQADSLIIIIPNVFTPNGDGSNDNFVIQLTGAALIKSLKAEVFNRWGERIANYELEIGNLSEIASSLAMTEITIWDGRTTAAALAPTGTYFYVISYETKSGELKSEKGSLSLLR